jgi:4-amino-4-deoxy-L-arabinose transferase-like glycosyltransferase
MIYRQKLELLALAGAVFITRFLFRSHDLYDIDSVNFGLAIRRFDPRVYQAHPPGYFLYICLGRLFNFFAHDANLALVLLSIAASCGTAMIVYRFALDWFGHRAAQFAAVLYLLSPLAWFHGIVALTYSVEAFFSALLGYLFWRIHGGRAALIVPASLVLGIAAGVRPSSLMFLGPLFLFSIRKAKPGKQLLGIAAVGLTIAAWFLPMIRISGGFGAYFGALFSLWKLVPSKDTVFNSSPGTSIARATTLVLGYFLCFGAASLAPLAARYVKSPADSGKKLFTAVWMAPALCFFTLIFFKFVNSGYLLLLLPPGCIWLGRQAASWYENAVQPRSVKLGIIAFCAAANFLIFFASPFYCSYHSVRRFERQLDGIRTALAQVGSADDTLIVGFDSHFLGYRHAGYYLPGYVTVQYPEVRLIEGDRIFAMHDRDTRLLTELPAGSYSRFVLFPLPGGEGDYRQYLETVKSRLPGQTLQTVRANGIEFVTGPVSDLPLLFPDAAPAQARVYMPCSSPGCRM